MKFMLILFFNIMNFNIMNMVTFLIFILLMKSKFKILMIINLMFLMNLDFYMMSFMNFYKNFNMSKNLIYLSLLFSLYLMMSENFLMFLLNFEMSIIMIFFYMMEFSSTENKIISCFYLLIYTSIFSLIFVFLILLKIKSNLSMMFFLVEFMKSKFNIFNLLYILIFLVKIPIFFLHIWLPKAHVESSCFGSMILSSIMLKLGGIGLLNFSNFMLFLNMKKIIFMYTLISSILVMLYCFFINDLKMIIAYLSVSHMSLLILSYFSNNNMSEKMSNFIMISHSISSPLMFLFSFILYSNFSSRMLTKVKSMFLNTSMNSWYMYIYMMLNMSIPPSMNFFAEILCFSEIILFDFNLFVILFIMISGMLTIYMMLKMFYKKELNSMSVFKILSSFEFMMFLMFFMFMILCILNMNMI